MKSKTFNTLEYNKILETLVSQASSNMAKDRLRELRPMTNAADIRDALAETTEAQTVILKKGNAPLGQLYDIADSLSYARKGGSLTMKQLLQILYNLKVAGTVITFLKSDLPELPILTESEMPSSLFRDLRKTSTDVSCRKTRWPTALPLSLKA